MDLTLQNNLYSIAIILLALININRLTKQNLILTGEGGLHVNLLIFYGLGALANGFTIFRWEWIIARGLYQYFNEVQATVALTYLALTILILAIKKKPLSDWLNIKGRVREINRITLILLSLSIVGYVFAEQEFAQSGIGTIFPVLRNLLFPTLVLLIYNVRRSNKTSILLLILGLALIGVNSFLSVWRSQLIMFMFSIGAGLMLKDKRFILLGLIAGPLFFIVILPFQNAKKYGRIKNQGFSEAVIGSFKNTKVSPFELSVAFVAERMSYARESAYVLRGIDKGYIEYRYGATYAEAIFQLVPRLFWPDKPSYNQLVNRIIPRKIGLVNKLDRNTSWGVNYFAEFLYNFPLIYLPLFFLLYWSLIQWLDKLTGKLNLSRESLMMLRFSLFFLVLNTVSLTYSSTYFVWLFVTIKIVDRFIKRKSSANSFYSTSAMTQ